MAHGTDVPRAVEYAEARCLNGGLTRFTGEEISGGVLDHDELFMPANLGISTDLLLAAQTGIVQQQNEYIVVRTPDAPEYYFGNLLVLKGQPADHDRARLEADFGAFVGRPPQIQHRTFVWPDSEAATTGLDGWIEAGYEQTHNCVLIAESNDLRFDIATNPSVAVRPYRDQADWDAWMAIRLADNFTSASDTGYLHFLSQQQAAHKRLIAAGLGDWWGAYIDGEQVGNLGLLFFDGIGRFQSVITAEKHQNKRVCKTLVRDVSARAFARARQLVIVADECYHAGRIYETMGFVRRQWVSSLCREPSAVTGQN